MVELDVSAGTELDGEAEADSVLEALSDSWLVVELDASAGTELDSEAETDSVLEVVSVS